MMLQPCILLRNLPHSCRCFSSIAPRTYAANLQQQPAKSVESNLDPNIIFSPPPARDKAGVALRTYKPRTPGVRHLRRPINDHLWKGRPLKALTYPKKGHGKGGRNNTGRITVRHRGGGHKRRIRTVDFDRKEPGPRRFVGQASQPDAATASGWKA